MARAGLERLAEAVTVRASSIVQQETNIVGLVVIARAWHDAFVQAWVLAKPDNSPMRCDESVVYGSLVMVGSAATQLAIAAFARGKLPLLAPLCGMLSGWSFVQVVNSCTVEGEGRLLAAATLSSATAVVLLGSADLLTVHARRRKTATAEAFALRMCALLTNACALGSAAAWYKLLSAMTNLREYAHYHASGRDEACGVSASLLGDLPSPAVLLFMFAVMATTLCSIINDEMADVRAAVAEEMEFVAAQRIQAQMRGCHARRKLQRDMRTNMQGVGVARFWRNVTSSHGPVERKAGVRTSSPSSPRSSCDSALSSSREAIRSAARAAHSAVDGLAEVTRLVRSPTLKLQVQQLDRPTAPQSPPSDPRNLTAVGARLLGLHVWSVVIRLGQKTLGFVVGWAWFDALHQMLPHTLPPWGFALVTTVICFARVKIQQTRDERSKRQTERVMLATAVGLCQGWAWAEAVDYHLTSSVSDDVLEGTKLDEHRVPLTFAMVAALSLALFGLRICVQRTHARLIRHRLRQSVQRARAFVRLESAEHPEPPAARSCLSPPVV